LEQVVNPERSWVALERRMASESNPRHKLLLEQVRNHMRSELREQLAPVMKTLCDDPIYKFVGIDGLSALTGRAEVESYYRSMFAQGRMNAEFVIERIVVDDETVVTEGVMVALSTSAKASDANQSANDGVLISKTPLLVVWPTARDGRLIGENIYLGSPTLEKVPQIS
jgi:limonene-1,2-epoxide hydrolase